MTVLSGGTAAEAATVERACFGGDPWSEETLADMLAMPHIRLWTARDNGDVCGYLIASVIAGEGEILRVATVPEKRRQGIGHALLSAFLCGTEEPERVFLEVRSENTAALALYRAFGFSVCGRRKNYYRNPVDDAVCMARTKHETERKSIT